MNAHDQETQQQERSKGLRKNGPLREKPTGTAKSEMHQSQLLKTSQL